jgi:hypothetical protein
MPIQDNPQNVKDPKDPKNKNLADDGEVEEDL